MRTRSFVAFAFVAAVIGTIALQSCSNHAGDDEPIAAAAPTVNAPSRDAAIENGSGADDHDSAAGSVGADHPLPSASAREATSVRLADGDSFDIVWSDSGERDEIRLIGLNAPEGDACFGDEARAVLSSLIEGQALLVDGIERDEFGRVLADVWVADRFVNGEMIERGAALALSDGAPHAQVLADAQARAQGAVIGLWSPDACGADPKVPLRIAHIEFDAPGRDNENQNGEWIEVANSGANSFDLSGWSIRDESTRNRYHFPSGFALGPDAAVRIFSGCGTDTLDKLYWCARDPVWNNGGDTGLLVDPDGRFGDRFSYSG